MEDKVYAVRYNNLVFQPSKCAEAWAIYLDKPGLKELTEQDKEFWEMLEQSIFRSTGSYKLFRRSLVENVKKSYADVSPRRPCNRRDKTGKRPESAHHTYVDCNGLPDALRCTCEGFFYRNSPNRDLKSVCPHIFANMIVQTIEKEKPILPFDFNANDEEIINVLLLSHKHRISYYEIDAYLFEKYGKAILTPKYKEFIDTDFVKTVSCSIKNPRNLEKLLEKDYKRNKEK